MLLKAQFTPCLQRFGLYYAVLLSTTLLWVANASATEFGTETTYGMATYAAPYLSDKAQTLMVHLVQPIAHRPLLKV
jgi:hypothetical protein